MSSTNAAFTVRFLRNGDSIRIVKDILKSNGEGAALFQMVDTTSGNVAPDWGVAENQPIIRLTFKSMAGYPLTFVSIVWSYDGNTVNFPNLTTQWQNSTTEDYKSLFQARINSDGFPELKIIGNIAGSKTVSNKQIDFSVEYISSAHKETIEGSIDVLIQQAGASSHMLQITTNRVELSGESVDDTYKATLSISAYYGISPVTIGTSGYTAKWYKDGTEDANEIAGSTNKTSIEVTRDDIDGGSIFICKLFYNGNAVAQDQQRINDISDEYQVVARPSSTSANYCTPTNNAVYVLTMNKNGEAYTGGVIWHWEVFNANGTVKGSGDSDIVTVTPDMCKMDGTEEYSDVDVLVTCNF